MRLFLIQKRENFMTSMEKKASAMGAVKLKDLVTSLTCLEWVVEDRKAQVLRK